MAKRSPGGLSSFMGLKLAQELIAEPHGIAKRHGIVSAFCNAETSSGAAMVIKTSATG